MSSGTPTPPTRNFVRRVLPCVVGLGALAGYLATLNHWLTLSSLGLVGEVSHGNWQPQLYQPVLAFLTWPLAWAPARWTPLALNAFAAGCGALTLALLARSVALLIQVRREPQPKSPDRRPAELSFSTPWAPPVLAAVALGLQLTFWSHATAASAPMLDALLFAVIVWCLLEYRRERADRWLDAAALAGGVALANSWTMAGFVPLLALALARSQQLQFFSRRFLHRTQATTVADVAPELMADFVFFLRMAALGLAGFSLVLVLPLAQSFESSSSLGFWPAARQVLGAYKANLGFCREVFAQHREAALLLAAVGLAPVLFVGIRWRAAGQTEHNRSLGLEALAVYAVHVFLLLTCLGVTFDPPFSPHQLSRRLGLNLPFLGLAYLGALSIGGYADFLLSVFQGAPDRHWSFRRVLGWASPKVVYALIVLVPLGLLWLNLPTLRRINGPQLERYANLIVRSLPPEGAVVLSSDPVRLALLRAALDQAGQGNRYLPVQTTSLPLAPYRAWLRRTAPQVWPADAPASRSSAEVRGPDSGTLNETNCLRLLARVAESNHLCSLLPDFGSLAETYDFQPHGLAYELRPYPAAGAAGTPLGAKALAGNQAFWEQVIETEVDPLVKQIAAIEHPLSGLSSRLMERGHLSRPVPDHLRALAAWYASALDNWGVT